MAALAAQVLAVGQQPGGARALEGQPGVDEGRGATVVIHEERLRIEMEKHTVRQEGTPSCVHRNTRRSH